VKAKDEIAFGPEVSPGVRLALRRQGDAVKQGLVRPIRDGEPLQPGEELVTVGAPSGGYEEGRWHELTSIYKRERTSDNEQTSDDGERNQSGPPQVETPAYREGYDRIFGKKPSVGLA